MKVKKTKWWLIFLLISGLIGEDIQFNTKQTEDNYCQKLTGNQKFCMNISLSYPVITDQDKSLSDRINRAIKQLIPTTNAHDYVKEYLKEVENDVGFADTHSDETAIELLSLTPRTFTLIVSGSSYTGGAHGNYGVMAHNYDRISGEELNITDIFDPVDMATLTKIAEETYRDEEGIMPTESLSETLGWFEDQFILSQSIAIGTDGLHFDYNPYEIKPYVAGVTELVVPYERLTTIIKPNSLLSPMVKKLPNTDKKNVSRTFKEINGVVDIEIYPLQNHHLKLVLTATNLTDYTIGGVSLSFPQLKDKTILAKQSSTGFDTVTLYGVGSKLYYRPTKQSIISSYILIEADSKRWKTREQKTVNLILDIPASIPDLYLNLRVAFRKKKDIIPLPSYGIEDQQGFYNYHIKIPLK